MGGFVGWSVGGWLRGQAGWLVLPQRRLVGWLVRRLVGSQMVGW